MNNIDEDYKKIRAWSLSLLFRRICYWAREKGGWGHDGEGHTATAPLLLGRIVTIPERRRRNWSHPVKGRMVTYPEFQRRDHPLGKKRSWSERSGVPGSLADSSSRCSGKFTELLSRSPAWEAQQGQGYSENSITQCPLKPPSLGALKCHMWYMVLLRGHVSHKSFNKRK